VEHSGLASVREVEEATSMDAGRSLIVNFAAGFVLGLVVSALLALPGPVLTSEDGLALVMLALTLGPLFGIACAATGAAIGEPRDGSP
jgi:purine-cytosine permease-like protein